MAFLGPAGQRRRTGWDADRAREQPDGLSLLHQGDRDRLGHCRRGDRGAEVGNGRRHGHGDHGIDAIVGSNLLQAGVVSAGVGGEDACVGDDRYLAATGQRLAGQERRGLDELAEAAGSDDARLAEQRLLRDQLGGGGRRVRGGRALAGGGPAADDGQHAAATGAGPEPAGLRSMGAQAGVHIETQETPGGIRFAWRVPLGRPLSAVGH